MSRNISRDGSGRGHVAIQMNEDGVQVQGGRMRGQDYGAIIGIGVLFLVLALSCQFLIHIPPEYSIIKTVIVLLFGLGALTMFGIAAYFKLTEPGRPARIHEQLRQVGEKVQQRVHAGKQKEHAQKEQGQEKQDIGLFN